MQIQIDLPDRWTTPSKKRARQLHFLVQAVAIQAIKKRFGHSCERWFRRASGGSPLIRSAKPGSLRSLTNAEIDAILD